MARILKPLLEPFPCHSYKDPRRERLLQVDLHTKDLFFSLAVCSSNWIGLPTRLELFLDFGLVLSLEKE